VQATPLPTYSGESSKIENCDLKDTFNQPIEECKHQRGSNFWAFLQAKVVQAFDQLNPDRDTNCNFQENNFSNLPVD